MAQKYRKPRSHTPAWADTLISGAEIIGAIATILAALYVLVTWLF